MRLDDFNYNKMGAVIIKLTLEAVTMIKCLIFIHSGNKLNIATFAQSQSRSIASSNTLPSRNISTLSRLQSGIIASFQQ